MSEPENLLGGRIAIHCGDCFDVVRGLADSSIDSVVTDPPYALVSIVKRFGGANAAPARDGDVYARASAGFMGKQWDTGETAFAVEFWAEVLRVLKPGGHVAAFGGTRSYHRLACAIEDAGFEIRDSLMWHYGQGFPKSLDVSKAIDKAAGAERKVVGRKADPRYLSPANETSGSPMGNLRPYANAAQSYANAGFITASATAAARQWEGWGTALKPSTEIICLARKPLSEPTVAANVLRWGTGALNVDGCRVASSAADQAAIARVVGFDASYSNGEPSISLKGGEDGSLHRRDRAEFDATKGRWPANIVHDGSPEVLAAFPESKGQQGDVRGDEPSECHSGVYSGPKDRQPFSKRNDSGSSARFFYCAKASKADRAGSKHPTVKPVKLMQWLVRLITPPGGVVLDPFAGTGTTGAACDAEGFAAVLIEREAEYQADIRRRIARIQEPHEQPESEVKNETKINASLFDLLGVNP